MILASFRKHVFVYVYHSTSLQIVFFFQIEPLGADEIRWFYSTKKNKLKPMLGCDSIRLEREWRLFNFEHCSPYDIKRVPIRGGMYEVRAYVS